MQQMKTWGAMASGLMAFILVIFFAVGPLFGQAGQVMQVEIPYEFTFGSKVLPAGKYSFSVDKLLVRAQSATGGTFMERGISSLAGPNELIREGCLVFDKTGGGHILSEIWLPEAGGILLHSILKKQDREFLLLAGLVPTRKLSGKAAYNLTCARCHGADGKGNERADKFFNITIPRLASAEVQGKSDAELRGIINKGTSAMPPVEIDESGFQHRLPAQDVDALIAYLRTLKQ
jgi:cytochrome c5